MRSPTSVATTPRAELLMAFEYLDIARSQPEFAHECTSRALRLYVLLSGWVQSNGGEGRLEQQLQYLRWRILNTPEDLTVTTGEDLMRKCG
jgi:hypothetical protein